MMSVGTEGEVYEEGTVKRCDAYSGQKEEEARFAERQLPRDHPRPDRTRLPVPLSSGGFHRQKSLLISTMILATLPRGGSFV